MTDSAIQKLVDRTDILDVYARYALGMDRGDRELFASAWSEDAVWECGALKLDLHGRDAIVAYFEQGPGRAPGSPVAGSNLRVSANHLIQLDGDKASVMAEMAAFRYTGEVVHPYCVGVYEDEFVRTTDGWRLSYRNMIVNPVVPAPAVGGTG